MLLSAAHVILHGVPSSHRALGTSLLVFTKLHGEEQGWHDY